MNAEDILGRVEQDARNEQAVDGYRFVGLMEAIRFFSNRLTVSQISAAAFDFVNEMLLVERSVLYLLDGNEYRPSCQRGCVRENPRMPRTEALDSFAVYCGQVLADQPSLERFFTREQLDAVGVRVLLPLLVEDHLHGFFLLGDKINGRYTDSDVRICESLMMLFDSALENSLRMERLQKSNRELDEKVFTLFAMNQSARVMLTEFDLDRLNQLAVDIFSELTLSAHTAFVLFDDPSETYVLKAFRDVYNACPLIRVRLTRSSEPIPPSRRILVRLDVPAERAAFARLFNEAPDCLESFQAQHVILIVGANQRLLGFVTLGAKVNGEPYSEASFELVESLASYAVIALSNAMLAERTARQHRLLQQKLDRLERMNALIKNINSALDLEALLDVAAVTLDVSFGALEGLIALAEGDDGMLRIRRSWGGGPLPERIAIPGEMEVLRSGSLFVADGEDAVARCFGAETAGGVKGRKGFLAVPIYIEREEPLLLGMIVLFDLAEGGFSDGWNTVAFETIGNSIAPLINGFQHLPGMAGGQRETGAG